MLAVHELDIDGSQLGEELQDTVGVVAVAAGPARAAIGGRIDVVDALIPREGCDAIGVGVTLQVTSGGSLQAERPLFASRYQQAWLPVDAAARQADRVSTHSCLMLVEGEPEQGAVGGCAPHPHGAQQGAIHRRPMIPSVGQENLDRDPCGKHVTRQ